MSYVYLMESIRDYDTVYKIGYSKNPNKRLNAIQTGNDGHVRLVHCFKSKHARKLEKALQNSYKHAHKNMEWFSMDLNDVWQFPEKCEKIEHNLDLIENFII